jgi:histidine triad (HIT) family protein
VHEPPGYACPFCRLLSGEETERNRLDDVVWRGERATAFVSPKWWPGNPGAAIVVPNAHVENLYEIDDELLAAVYAAAKRVALAMKVAYGCDGTSTRQHNEPGGQQDVWHFHVHVFPRWHEDGLYERQQHSRWVPPAERAGYAARLAAAIAADPPQTGV